MKLSTVCLARSPHRSRAIRATRSFRPIPTPMNWQRNDGGFGGFGGTLAAHAPRPRKHGSPNLVFVSKAIRSRIGIGSGVRRGCCGDRASIPLALSGDFTYMCPMPSDPSRTARIEARIAPETLLVVKRAAELQGRSVSDFIVAAAQAEAHRMIEETQIIRLSVEDQRAFAAAILNPPAPNDALKRAASAHRSLIRDPM